MTKSMRETNVITSALINRFALWFDKSYRIKNQHHRTNEVTQCKIGIHISLPL